MLLVSVSLKRLWREALDGDFDAFGTTLGVDEKSKAGFACPPALTLVGLSAGLVFSSQSLHLGLMSRYLFKP